jgi:hypothetical protein
VFYVTLAHVRSFTKSNEADWFGYVGMTGCMLCFTRGHPVEISGKLELLIYESYYLYGVQSRRNCSHTRISPTILNRNCWVESISTRDHGCHAFWRSLLSYSALTHRRFDTHSCISAFILCLCCTIETFDLRWPILPKKSHWLTTRSRIPKLISNYRKPKHLIHAHCSLHRPQRKRLTWFLLLRQECHAEDKSRDCWSVTSCACVEVCFPSCNLTTDRVTPLFYCRCVYYLERADSVA